MLDNSGISRTVHDAWYTRLLQGGDRHGWVVTDDGRPVGACFLSAINATDRRGYFGMYVAEPASRGRGVGGASLRLLCDRAFTEHGLHKLCCQVLASNEV